MKKFVRDRKGAFAMQFALMVVPLTVCTGLAIDGGRAFLARFELESALDAAALAVGSSGTANGDLNAVAQTYVDKNFHSPHSGPIALTLTPDDDVVTLHGTVTINTYFMPIVGQDTVTVSAESEVRRGGGNVEVALALDITQSMSGSKMTALKQAAKDLVDTVVNDNQSPYFSKVALAPWGTNIHVSTYANAMRGTVTGPATITAATWRNGAAHNITGGNWRKGAAVTSVTANWRTGSEFTVSSISKVSGSPARLRITVTGTPSALVNGDTVGLYTPSSGSADGSFATYKNQAYKLADKSGTTTATFNLQDLSGNYVTPPSGTPTNGTSWRVMECLNSACQMRLSNSGTNNLANGDYVHLTGFSSPYAALNNAAADGTWQVTSSPTAPTSTTAFINVVGPTIGSPNYTTGNATGGTIQECYTSTCEYAITAAGHGFADGDQVLISGTSVTTTGGGATDIDNTTSPVTTWTIGDVTTDTFTLPGAGTSYQIWTAGGSASKCITSACEVQVTASGHGLADNDWVQIGSVGGMTGINNSGSGAWQVKSVSGANFVLTGSVGPNYSNYTSGGSAQCLEEGCQKYRFLDASYYTGDSTPTYQIKSISNCVTERTGANAATDVAPSTAPLGRDYAGSGSLVGCQTANNILPLSSNKSDIKTKIDNMTVYGSTAGEIGAAWAWYMLSPNWGYLWPADSNRPKAYDYKHLSKVAVLMTDGEFNTAHCHGVTSESYHVGSVSDSDLIDTSVCTPSKAPFDQAQDICTAMKAQGIIVYTIGFQVGSEPGAADFLTACASTTSHVFLAADSAALNAAFKSIAKSITKLRLSK